VYAARFIYEGYKAAFMDKGHEFRPLTAQDDLKEVLEKFEPDIFITSLNRYNLKFIDLEILKKYRDKGMVMFTQIRPWKKQSSQFGGSDLENDKYLVDLIVGGLAGDIFFHWIEQDDPAMDGFTKTTGYPFYTIILAANKKMFFPEYDDAYKADISFVGSYIPGKRKYLNELVLPLKDKYDLKLYGSDWSTSDRLLGYIQKVGQYLNISPLKKVRGIKLPLEDERKVYSSSLISLNLHEGHQKEFGSDFNERTFKVIASGGFQIVDNVAALRKYFNEKELVIAKDEREWFELIDHYVQNPDERIPIVKAGRKKVLENHTYHHRADQIVGIYKDFKS
jgi:hypothetical protein